MLDLTFRGRVQAPLTPFNKNNNSNHYDYDIHEILTSAPSECCWTGDDGLWLRGCDLPSVHCVGGGLGDKVEAGRVNAVAEARRLWAVLKKDQ